MSLPKLNDFAERRKTAMEARQKILKKFEAAPKPDDPEMIAKRAEREKIAAARDARRAERERVKQEKVARKQAEIAARKAAEEAARAEAEAKAKAEAEAREAEKHKLVAQVIANEAERKAERDRKYAARKARKAR